MEVIWTAYSLRSLSELLLFVRNRWGDRKAVDVRNLIQHDTSLLEHNPEMGKVIPECESLPVKIRSLVIKRKNKLFYKLEDGKIYILLVWDVRKDPEYLRELLTQFITV